MVTLLTHSYQQVHRMSIKLTQDVFRSRAQKIHGSRYDFSQAVYTGRASKVTVTCPIHGDFRTLADSILGGHGCGVCGREATTASSKWAPNELLEALKAKHPQYVFKEVTEGTRVTDKIEVECPRHGAFRAAPHHLMKGKGCPACGKAQSADTRRFGIDDFLSLSRKAHGDNYDYSRVTYKGYQDQVEIVCKIHGSFMQGAQAHYLTGQGCPKCSTNKNSKPQLEIVEFVRSLGLEVVENYRYDPANHNKEIDIYVPERKWGMEYHGIYFHSTKFRGRTFHLDKMKDTQAQGIRLAQLFSDEWETRPEVVKRYILHSLGYGLLTVFARKCEVVPLTLAEANEFYDEHHIQGRCGAGTNYGLAYKGQVVAAMAFSRRTSKRGKAPDEGTWELARFATSMRVTGGASRLMARLIRETGATALVSYSDNRLFAGDMYEKLGFELENSAAPNYAYVDKSGGKRLRKSKFQHKHLAKLLGDKYDPTKSERENCEASGYFQIFDCGLKRWKLTCP